MSANISRNFRLVFTEATNDVAASEHSTGLGLRLGL